VHLNGDDRSTDHPANSDAANGAERLAGIAAVAASAALSLWLLWACRAGIDFTDEGFYLNWISNPQTYLASHTQFGFLYHPLFRIIGGDVVLLRQANVLLTLGLGWGLFSVLFQTSVPSVSTHRAPWVGLGFVLATSTFALLYMWLPTPNYRSLALQALLLAGIGILLAETNYSRRSITGWVILGVAGWMAFMAKPTTAAALAVTTSVYLLVASKMRFRLVAITGGTALLLLLISAWCIDGSIVVFIRRLMNGAEDLRLLQGRYTLAEILRWDRFGLGVKEKITLAASTLFIAVGTRLSASSLPIKRRIPALLVLAISVLGVWITFGLHRLGLTWSPGVGSQFLAFPIGAGLATLAFPRNESAPALTKLLPLSAWFLVCPYVFVFGTNLNYWNAVTGGVVFWVAAGTSLLMSRESAKLRWSQLLPLAITAQAGVSAILYASMEKPYRQSEPLRVQSAVIRLPAGGVELKVSREAARYVNVLKRTAEQGGLRPGDGIIDLTGHYPTALYLLGATAVGLPWTSGGYKGSIDVLTAALDRVPGDELKRAWILMEPAGPRAFSAEILQRYGIDLERDYVSVGDIDSPQEEYPDRYVQVLLKPRRSSHPP